MVAGFSGYLTSIEAVKTRIFWHVPHKVECSLLGQSKGMTTNVREVRTIYKPKKIPFIANSDLKLIIKIKS